MTYQTAQGTKDTMLASLKGMVSDLAEAVDDAIEIEKDPNHHYTEQDQIATEQYLLAGEDKIKLIRRYINQ